MTTGLELHPIVIYIIEKHPLDTSDRGAGFRWIEWENAYEQELRDLIGPFNPNEVSILIDPTPAGSAWSQMLDGLLSNQVRKVITHLAPLSPAQRQQLIGVCAQMGAQLITPSDAGRSSDSPTP